MTMVKEIPFRYMKIRDLDSGKLLDHEGILLLFTVRDLARKIAGEKGVKSYKIEWLDMDNIFDDDFVFASAVENININTKK